MSQRKWHSNTSLFCNLYLKLPRFWMVLSLKLFFEGEPREMSFKQPLLRTACAWKCSLERSGLVPALSMPVSTGTFRWPMWESWKSFYWAGQNVPPLGQETALGSIEHGALTPSSMELWLSLWLWGRSRLPAAPQLALLPLETKFGLNQDLRKGWKPSCHSHGPGFDALLWAGPWTPPPMHLLTKHLPPPAPSPMTPHPSSAWPQPPAALCFWWQSWTHYSQEQTDLNWCPKITDISPSTGSVTSASRPLHRHCLLQQDTQQAPVVGPPPENNQGIHISAMRKSWQGWGTAW